MKAGYSCLLLAAAISVVTSFTIYTQRSDLYCLAEDENPYLQFSTQTSYQVARNRKSIQPVPQCKPEAVWLLTRHGTRFPEPEVDERMRELTQTVIKVIQNHDVDHNGELCRDDLEALKNWHYSYQSKDLGELAEEGKSDLRILAGSYKIGLPELFANASPDKTVVKYTISPRTKASAAAFLEGLNRTIDWSLSDNNIDDVLMVSSGYSLDPNKNCTEWDNSWDTPEAVREKDLYKSSSDMKSVIHRVSSRLGFKYDLEFSMVRNMYDLCRSEKAVYYQRPVSPWCAAFTKEDLVVLEYYMDLSYYYNSGYGNPMTMKLGCPLVRDMLLKLENITKNNGTQDISPLTLYFAHSVTIRAAITKLGLARDSTPPKHDNVAASADRQWKTSRIAPFTANLAVVLYRCTSGEEWKIMFYLNEHLVNYEGCDLGLCDFSYIMSRFKDHIDPERCNLDFCFTPNSANSLKTVGIFLLTAILALERLIF